MRVMNQCFARALMLVVAVALLSACGGKEERKAKYLERGKAFLVEKNYEKAKLEFRNVLQIDPKTADAYLYLGEIEEKKQNWPQAFGNYKKASELDPGLISARVHLAQFYIAQAGALREKGGQEENAANAMGLAQEQIKEILSRDPDNLDGLTLEATLWADDGDTDKAAAQLERVIASDPGNQSAAMLLANIYVQKDRASDAEQVLMKAIARSDDPIGLQTRLAGFYSTQQQNDKAEGVLRKIVAENPDEIGYRVSLASFLTQTDQLEKAEKVLRDTIAADPSDAQRYLLLTEFYAAKRGRDTAIAELKRMIDQKPDMSDLKLSLVRMYLANDEMEQAKSLLADIISIEGTQPAGIKARVGLARIIAAEDPDNEKVRSLVEEVLQENPRDNEALLLKGKLAARQGNFEEAIADFRSVLKDQPNSPEVLQLLASAHVSNDETVLARDTLMRGVQNNPKNESLRLSLARLLAQSSDIDAALEQVEAVLEDDRHHGQALALKYELLARKGDAEGMEAVARLIQAGAPDKEDGFIKEARLRVAQKDYAAALAILDKILDKNPESVPALLAKSDALAAQGKFKAALPVVDQLKKVTPDSAVGYFRKGKLLQQEGDAAAALSEFAQGLEKEPESVDILTALVALEVKHSGADKAEKRLLDMLAANPDHRSANEFLGLVYMGQKDFAKAEKAFRAQLAVNPESAVVHTQLAQVRLAQKDLAGAADVYRKGLEALPNDVRLLIGLAGVEEALKNFDGAMALYEQVLTHQPDNAVSINNLAALLSDHRTDPASLDRAADLASKLEKTNQPAFVDTAGWVYYRKGDYETAVEILKSVVEQAPKVPVFRYHLGMAYLKSGDKAAAREHLLKATDGDFRYSGIEEARAALETL